MASVGPFGPRGDVVVDGAGHGVGVERFDDVGEALFDGHPPCVALDEFFRAGGVVPDVVGGFGVGHRWHGVAHADALVQGGQDAQAHALPESGLSDQEHRKWGS